MAQIQLLKRRIRSVGNTRQITKAMELVSASKMRKSQDATRAARPYAQSAVKMLHQLQASTNEVAHPLLAVRNVEKRCVILVTSDRGLAGAYNSNLLRLLVQHIKDAASPVELIIIGQKGADFASRLSDVTLRGVYAPWPTQPTAADVRPISRTVLSLYEGGEIDQVDLLYTHFHSTIKQSAMISTLLPIQAQATTTTERQLLSRDILFEPSPEAVLSSIVPRLLESLIYQAILEAQASEHSARMMAMKNASDNAESLIDELTATYNSARQAYITQELAEITSGAEAMQ